MKLIDWAEYKNSASQEAPLVCTIGVFDGVHLGHQRLLAYLVESAGKSSLPAVFTFRENPKRILRPDSYLGDLSSLDQRCEVLEALGVKLLVLISYDAEFGAMSGESFLHSLRQGGEIKKLLMGEGSRIGSRASMTSAQAVESMRSKGVAADIIPSLLVDSEVLSSSRLRSLIASGRMAEAGACLGRPYEIDLKGLGSSRLLGKKGLVTSALGQILPPTGSYRGLALGPEKSITNLDIVIKQKEKAIELAGLDVLPSRLRFV